METYLPDSLKMLEYKPSMVGIPTQSVARLYDRLDKQAYAADAQSTKMQTVLAHQLANATDGDKPYLQNMYNTVESLIDKAKDEKNLPGYATQIRNMVGDMVSDQTFAGIQENSKKIAKYAKDQNAMVMQFGAENVIDSGDNPTSFSTINPDTQELQAFMGQVTRRPDYTSTMMKLFKGNTDILENEGALQRYVESGGAYTAYSDTPEGRIHLNDMANQLFDTPYIRLAPDKAMAVQGAIEEKLINVGLLEMRSGIVGGGDTSWSSKGMYKKEFMQSLVSGGTMGTSLTDGGPGEDQTIQAFGDHVKDSVWDAQLISLLSSDREFLSLDIPGYNASIQPGERVNPSNVTGVEMTSALSASGNPILMVKVAGQTKISSGASQQEASPPGVAYVEMPKEDIGFLLSNAGGFMGQLAYNTKGDVRKAALPLVSSLYAPELGPFIMARSKKYVALPGIKKDGLTIKREGGYYIPYDDNGKQYADGGGNPLRFADASEVRSYVGRSYLHSNYSRR